MTRRVLPIAALLMMAGVTPTAATLRAALKDALTVIARQRYGPRFQTLTDEGEAYTTS